MTSQHPPVPPVHPDPCGHTGADLDVPHLELDESVPPRPEEDVADALRVESGRG